MVTDESQQDKEKRLAAEMALQHVRDQQRLIQQMGPAVHELMSPIRQRRLANKFMEEYEAIYQRKPNE